MALPARSLEDDRRLLYAIAEALGIASGVEFPTAFPPLPHAPTHEVGGTDVVTIADAQITSLDWSKLTGVPATFPPSAHAASHQFGGADNIPQLGNDEYEWQWAANGVTLAAIGADPNSRINGVGRMYFIQHEGAVNGSIQWASSGTWPNTGAECRIYGGNGGNNFRVSYTDGRQESVQSSSFADELQGVAETPNDYLTQEIFRLQDQMAAVIPYLLSRNGPPIPNPFPAITDPYPNQTSRPRRPPVGSIP